MINSAKLALIHVAKMQLHLADDEYRMLLDSVCGVSSAKEIRTDADFKALLNAFERLGFRQKAASAPRRATGLNFQIATAKQFDLIVRLWKKYTRFPEQWEETLNSFITRRFGVANYRKLNRAQCGKLIEILKEMLMRAALVEVSEFLCGPNPTLVENQLFNLYERLRKEIPAENLAAILAVLCYQDDNASKGFLLANQLLQRRTISEKPNKELNDEKASE